MRGYTISIWRLGSGAVSAILEGIGLQGAAHESRPDRLRTACRTPAEARFRERRRALRPRAPRPKLLVRGPVSRSTLSDANEQRDYRIFMDTATAMIAAARLELPVDADLRRLNAEAYAIDSTTIDLCLKLFPWAHFRRRKGGIKVHTMFDLGAGIPVFLRVSHAKTHDLWIDRKS